MRGVGGSKKTNQKAASNKETEEDGKTEAKRVAFFKTQKSVNKVK